MDESEKRGEARRGEEKRGEGCIDRGEDFIWRMTSGTCLARWRVEDQANTKGSRKAFDEKYLSLRSKEKIERKRKRKE